MLTKGYETVGSALRKAGTVGFSAMALVAFAISAQANLVTNGNFNSYTCFSPAVTCTGNLAGGGQLGLDHLTATGWSNPTDTDSFAFVFENATVAQSGVQSSGTAVALWGPNNGSSNGFTAPPSPDGPGFAGADSQYNPTVPAGSPELWQTVNGLTVGASYTLTFYYAAAQQTGHTGSTQSAWNVGFGTNVADAAATTQDAPLLSIGSEGFSGWTLETMTFVADSTSDTLYFTPTNFPAGSGLPPFSLLDGVDLESTVPEPGYLAVGFGIMGLMLGMAVIRKKRIKA